MANIVESQIGLNQEKDLGRSQRASMVPRFIEETHELSEDDMDPPKKECFLKMLNPITVIEKKFHAGGIKSTIVTLISGT